MDGLRENPEKSVTKMETHIRDMEDFKRPSRKPWLLLAAGLVVGGFLLHRYVIRPRMATAEKATRVERRMTADKTGKDRSGKDLSEKSSKAERLAPRKDQSVAGSKPQFAGDAKRPLEDGKLLESQNDLVGAREKYLQALEHATSESVRNEAEDRIGKVNVELVMSSRQMPEKVDYVVQKGDYLQKIAQSHGTSVDLIERSNGLKKGGIIKAGDLLRILKARFSIVVSKGRNDLVLQMDGKFFKRYRVGSGKDDKTPLGTFVISSKEKEPVWWPQGKEIPYRHPENILGTRWMAVKATGDTPDVRGYGIHGTWDDSTIGKSVSAGCVRMANTNVEEVFDLVVVGTPVTITN